MTEPPGLFSPGRIGSFDLKNRILMAPMEKTLALLHGAVTRRYIDYCEARAAGGAALLQLESMYVHPAGQNHRQLGIHDDELIPGYRRLIDACHRHEALVGAELQFGGRQTSSLITGQQPLAPSLVPCTVLTGGDVPRALTIDEIRGVLRAFADAAPSRMRRGARSRRASTSSRSTAPTAISSASSCRPTPTIATTITAATSSGACASPLRWWAACARPSAPACCSSRRTLPSRQSLDEQAED